MNQILLALLNNLVVLLALIRVLLSNSDSFFTKTLCLFALTALLMLLIAELIDTFFNLLGVTLQFVV